MPAPQLGLPWLTDGPAVPESREPASVAANPIPLSPAAQAVWDAWNDAYEAQGPLEDMGQPLGAALRAVADRMMSRLLGDIYHPKYLEGIEASVDFLEKIAAELENGANV